MKQIVLTLSFVLTLLLAATTNTRAQDELHKTFSLSPNGIISLTNVSGSIRITGWDENRVQVDAVKRGDREEFAQVEIHISDSPERLEITTIHPRGGWRGRNRVEVNYDLKVPRGVILAPITSTSGSITVTEAGSRLTARATSGNVIARAINGITNVASTSGDVTAEQIRGTLTIASTSGDVHLKDIEANVTAHTTSGDLTAQDVRADLHATATSGGLRIADVRGRVQAQSMSGKVTVKDIGGDATLQSISDSILAENVQGRLTATAVSADVTAHHIREGARINSVSGAITITNTKGLIEAKTTSGDISIRAAESREMLLNTHSGRINFSGAIFDDGRYSFESFNGTILLTLPATANFTLNATTFNGSIETDFSFTMPPGTAPANRPRRLQATYGKNNGAEIKVSGFNASIQVKKQ